MARAKPPGAARLSGRAADDTVPARQLATSHWFDISAARRDFGYRRVCRPLRGCGGWAIGSAIRLNRKRRLDSSNFARPSSNFAAPLQSPIHELAAIYCRRGLLCCELILAANCGRTTSASEVTLCGWVDSYRDHGGGLFVDLRDRYGKTQVVFNPPDTSAAIIEQSKSLRTEFVIQVTGSVAQRPDGTANPKLATGEIELRVTDFKLLNKSLTPPVSPSAYGQDLPNEDLRLKYRYLDLRRPEMQRTLLLRHRIIRSMRDYFDDHGFIDVETPMLGRSTPEGARDYLVPSRVHHGTFYALPQSPQLYKQILMIAGYDRYVQVARCFRDEDLRADRQPEFTQLDLEMSFVDADDIIGVIDGLVRGWPRKMLGPRRQAAAAADDLRRGDGALRPRRARPALRPGAGRLHRPGREVRLPRLRERRRRRRPRPRHQRQERRRALLAQAASTS